MLVITDCQYVITEHEILSAMKNMKHNKSPGCDGFPIEFYKVFWIDIGKYLLKSFNESFTEGILPLTQRQGIITCIHKTGKPREHLKNWRPISLLNADYKIVSTVIAMRMRKVLDDVISSDQKGFLTNRNIAENTRLVYDVMSELKRLNKPGMLLLVDFEKAFDSVEWSYIKKSIKGF